MNKSTHPSSPGQFAADLFQRHKFSPPLFNARAIESMIPHRPPFLLIDRILEFDPASAAVVGQKNTTAGEFYFQGHFPGAPIMPGVLIVESLAQTGGVLIHQMGFRGKIPIIVHLNDVRFRCAVHPGDQILTHCEGLHLSSRGGRIRARAIVGNRICAEAEIGYVLTPQDRI